MKTFKNMSFSSKIKWRIAGLIFLLVVMIGYAVVIAMLGYGNQSMMTLSAIYTSQAIFFGGMIVVLVKISKNRNLLTSVPKMKEKLLEEKDEGRKYLHMASGGIVWDVIFFAQLFLTLTAALVDTTAYYFSMCTLGVVVVVKLLTFCYAKYLTK